MDDPIECTETNIGLLRQSSRTHIGNKGDLHPARTGVIPGSAHSPFVRHFRVPVRELGCTGNFGGRVRRSQFCESNSQVHSKAA